MNTGARLPAPIATAWVVTNGYDLVNRLLRQAVLGGARKSFAYTVLG